MDSRRSSDTISTLEDVFLCVILSFLPFRDIVRTSVLSKRWKNVHLKMNDVSFKESEFVNMADDEAARRDARVLFVQTMVTWAERYSGMVIESLEICLSNPVGFEAEITAVIELAISKGCKNLVLDFSDPSWSSNDEVKGEANVFQLPECVYSSRKLESLKLFFCACDFLMFENPKTIKSLSFGWIELENIMTLVVDCPRLVSLSMVNCWNVGLEGITDNNRLRELIYKNCEFIMGCSTLYLPSIKIFKYTGALHYFQFMTVNESMEEVELDFEGEMENDVDSGNILADLLCDLHSARKLTLCPYVIQVITQSDEPVKLEAPMKTKHVVIKTSMQPNEFAGIRFIINKCPWLETLTFIMVPHRVVLPIPTSFQVETYWSLPTIHDCMLKTVKVVEVKGFTGTLYEVYVLTYFIKHCRILEKIELHVKEGLDKGETLMVRAAAALLRRDFNSDSNRRRNFIFNA